MPFDDLFANGQADASAWIVGAGMEPLEQGEDPLLILRLDADAVIAHAEEPLATLTHSRDMHSRRLIGPVELDAIGDQVLEQLAQLNGVALHDRQIVAGGAGTSVVNRRG